MTLTELKDYIQYGEEPSDKVLTPTNQNYDILTDLRIKALAKNSNEYSNYKYGVKLDKNTLIKNPQLNSNNFDNVLSGNKTEFIPIFQASGVDNFNFPKNFTEDIELDGETRSGIVSVSFGENYKYTKSLIGEESSVEAEEASRDVENWNNIKFTTRSGYDIIIIENGEINEENEQLLQTKYFITIKNIVEQVGKKLFGELEIYSLLEHNNTIYVGTNSGLYKLTDGSNFEQINGISSDVKSLLEHNNTIYAGTNNSLYKSTDGSNFEQINGINSCINSLLEYNSTIYIGTGRSLYKSTDGNSFEQINGINDNSVNSLLVYNNTIYAGTGGGLYKSTDGSSFEEINSTNGWVYWIYSLLVYNNTIYAGAQDGLYKLTEDGNLKKVNGVDDERTYSLLEYNNILYVCTEDGLYKLTEDGSLAIVTEIDGIRLEKYNNILYVVHTNGISKSIDGISFEGLGEGSFIGYYPSILYSNKEAIYIKTTNGLYKVVDKTLTNLNEIIIYNLFEYNNIFYIETNYGVYKTIDFDNFNKIIDISRNSKFLIYNNTFYIGTDHGLYSSTDGNNFKKIVANYGSYYGEKLSSIFAYKNKIYMTNSYGTFIYNITDFSCDFEDYKYYKIYNNILYAGTNSSLYKSTDGSNFEQINGISGYVNSLLVYNNTIYVGTNSGLYKSTDGNSFEQINGTSGWVYWTYSLLVYNNTIYVGNDSGLYKSTDGSNFEQINSTGNYIYSLLEHNNTIYVGTNSGLYKSTDGSNFEQIINNSSVKLLLEYNNILYAGNDNSLYKSADGNSFEQINGIANMSFGHTTDLLEYNNILYVGTNKGLYKSTDGINFIKIKTINDYISSFFEYDGVLYVCGAGSRYGLYKSTDGSSFEQIDVRLPFWEVYSFIIYKDFVFVCGDNGVCKSTIDDINNFEQVFGTFNSSLIYKNTLYISDDQGLYNSTDGINFEQVDNINVSKIVSLFEYNDNLYVGGFDYNFFYLFKLTDENKLEEIAKFAESDSDSVFSLFIYNDIIYVSTRNGLYETTIDNINFKKIDINITPYSFIIYNNALYVGTSKGICKINEEFTKKNNEIVMFPYNNNSSVNLLLEYNNILYVGTDKGLYKYTSPFLYCLINNSSVNLLLEYNNILYAGTNKGLYKSTDGNSFEQINSTGDYVNLLLEYNNILYADTNYGLYKSTDGSSFERTKSISGYIDSLLEYNNILYVGTDKGLYKSTDGSSFEQIINNSSVNLLLEYNNIIYAGTNKGLYKSTDGSSFEQINGTSDCGYIYSLLEHNNTIYVGTNKGLYKSTDGSSLEQINSTGNYIYSLLEHNNTIYVGTNKGLYKSTDGSSFEQIINNSSVNLLLEYNNIIYAGTNKGLYKSTDGSSFEQINGTSDCNYIDSLLEYNDILYIKERYVKKCKKIIQTSTNKTEITQSLNLNDYFLKCGYFSENEQQVATEELLNDLPEEAAEQVENVYDKPSELSYTNLNECAEEKVPAQINYLADEEDSSKFYFTESFDEKEYIEVDRLAPSFNKELALSEYNLTSLDDYTNIFKNLQSDTKITVGKNTFNENAYEGNKIKASLLGNYGGKLSKKEAIKKYYKIGDLKVLNYDYYDTVSASIPLEKIRKLFEE